MIDGIVLYTDGSFRQGMAGWGVHGYTYKNEPMKSKAATKQQPTKDGYQDVSVDKTCTVIDYIDAFGGVTTNPTNNTAELSAAINGFNIALKTNAKKLTMLMDSEYVRKNLENYVPKWIKNNWIKSDGNPVANKDLWVTLNQLRQDWIKTDRGLTLKWVEGHSGDIGNDKADVNALRGAPSKTDEVKEHKTEAIIINNLKKKPVSPLVMETRLLFMINSGKEKDGLYYMYSLGSMHNAGFTPKDTAKEKLAKPDMLNGRRISEATFGVYKALRPDEYIESLIDLHTKAFGTENPELGILNLSNCFNAKKRQQIESMGLDGLLKLDEIYVLATPDEALISRTLNPPRMANDAVGMFNILERHLLEYMDGKLGESVVKLDITELLFDTVTDGKKTVTQLKKSISNNTLHVEIPIEYKNRKIKLRWVLGIDVPNRNQLARMACDNIKIEVLLSPAGPLAYSYSTVFTTDDGSAIYGAPYAQFILT